MTKKQFKKRYSKARKEIKTKGTKDFKMQFIFLQGIEGDLLEMTYPMDRVYIKIITTNFNIHMNKEKKLLNKLKEEQNV